MPELQIQKDRAGLSIFPMDLTLKGLNDGSKRRDAPIAPSKCSSQSGLGAQLRKMSMVTGRELAAPIGESFAVGGETTHIPDKFAGLAGYHRKHTMRLFGNNSEI